MSRDFSQPIRSGWETDRQTHKLTDAWLYEGQHSVGVWTLKRKNNLTKIKGSEMHYQNMFTWLVKYLINYAPADSFRNITELQNGVCISYTSNILYFTKARRLNLKIQTQVSENVISFKFEKSKHDTKKNTYMQK